MQNHEVAKFDIRLFIQFLLVLTGVNTMCVPAWAQNTTAPDRGFRPAGSYALGDIESVNNYSGNLAMRIPLASLPAGRGGHPGASIGLSYNSKLYQTYTEKGTVYPFDPLTKLQMSPEGGWQWDFMYRLKEENFFDNMAPDLRPTCPSQDAIYSKKVSIVFPDGSEHLMKALGHNNGYDRIRPNGWVQGCDYPNYGYWTYGTVTYYSTDSTYLRLDVLHDNQNLGYNVWILYFPDGSRITHNETTLGYQRFYDRNGNFVEVQPITWNGQPAHKLIDQMNRYLIVQYDSVTGNSNVYQDGIGGGLQLQWVVKWTYSNVLKTYYPDGDNSVATNYYASFHSVQEISLPTQAGTLAYTFAYNGNANFNNGTHSTGYGEMSMMTLPSGASTAYQYAKDNIENIETTPILTNNVTAKTLSYRAEYDGLTGTAAPLVTEQSLYNSGSDDFVATVTNPNGGVSTEYFSSGYPYSKPYKTVAPDGSVVERVWQENLPNGDPGSGVYGSNPYVKTEYRSVKDGNGVLSKTAIKDYTYDKNGNVTQTIEYDWVAYSSVTRGGTYNLPTGIPGSAVVKRVNINTYYSPTPDAANTSYDADTYNQPTSPRLKNAVETSEVRSSTSSGSVLARTEVFYDNATTTGNVLTQKSWDSTKGAISYPLGAGNSITVSNTYDSYGNVTQTNDANSNVSKFSYASINGYTGLYPTQTIVGENVSNNSTIKRTTNLDYDFWRGLVTLATDVDNNIKTKTTYDVFGRPTLVEEGGTGSPTVYLRQTSTEYSDTLRRVIVRSSKDTKTDGLLISVQHYDQLGRVRLTRKLENGVAGDATDETKGVKVQTRYFAGNSTYPNGYSLVSNPYRTDYSYNAGSEYAMGWSRTKSDQAGRLIEAQTFGGATLPAPWGTNDNGTGMVVTSYDGERTLVKDQANKKRISEIDGLGRMATVWEVTPADSATESVSFPGDAAVTAGYKTTYAYDALDSLLTVNQRIGTGGTLQTRTFAYSSLKRLTSATNPESGTTTYQYDNNGNLTYKLDALNRSLTYYYDGLNRPQGYISNDSNTPQVVNIYDTLPYGKGKLGYSYTASYWFGCTSWKYLTYNPITSYDALGRPSGVTQYYRNAADTSWGTGYTTSQTYDLAGNVKSQTYPSGRVVNYTYNNAGQTSSFSGNLGGSSRNYATNILYTSAGQLTQERLGENVSGMTMLYHNRHYNNRQQLYDVRLGTGVNDGQGTEWTWNRGAIRLFYGSNWAYGNGGVENNGNITRMDHFAPTNEAASTWSMSLDYYQYDALNRIKGIWENRAAHNQGETSTGLTQQYLYDRFGNRTVNNTVSNFPGVFNGGMKIDETTNRLKAITDSSTDNINDLMRYDAVGNQTKDTYTGAGTRTYDANNKLVGVTGSGGGGATYTYNANGSRVSKMVITATTTTTWYIYGVGGELMAEYPADGATNLPQTEYGYRNGELLIEGGCDVVRWRVTDHLGSTRIAVDTTGSLTSIRRTDYVPFGEELGANVGPRTSGQGYGLADCWRQRFTGKERDAETGLDYFVARYLSSVQGRFISVDQGQPKLTNPQTWNRYRYASNNPLAIIDPDGNSDEAAHNPKINEALAKDPVLLEVIEASNNFSPRAFEVALERGDFNKSSLSGKSGNILRGLAGEAIVIERMRAASYPLVISQPINRLTSLTGSNVSLPEAITPDIGAVFLAGRALGVQANAGINNAVTDAKGTLGVKEFSPDIKFGLVEVKAGFTGRHIATGANQVAATATALRAARLPGVAVLAVDKGAWDKLSEKRRGEIYNTVNNAGGYIQVVDGLAVAAAQRARNSIKEAKDR